MSHTVDILPSIPSLRPSTPKNSQKNKRQSSYPPPDVDPVSRVLDGLLYLRDGLTPKERVQRRQLEERKQILSARLQSAESYREWDAVAHELDILEGNEEWKLDISSGDYNPDLLEKRLKELDDARAYCDMRAMMHLIRTALSRDLGGMGNIDLYRHSYCGTKKLIERYVDSTLQTITTLVEQSAHRLPDDLGPKDLLDAVLYARQSFGRSALLLSGGGTFGMTHIGVLKAMFEARLLPRIISGASAGSIVCSVVCSRTDDEIPQLLKEFPHGDLAVFEEDGNEDGLLGHLRRLLTEGNWSDIKHLTRVMRELLGDITFQEAYNRTRRICNICVSSASIYELPRLLNYVTAPNVMIWSAVAASCSVPLVFSAAPLLVKNPLTGEHSTWNPTPQMWIDGSVDSDLPMTRLAEMFNVNHFIVSQVNPHVVPFLTKDDVTRTPSGARHETIYREESDWLHTITTLAKSEALHRMQFMAEIGIFPTLVSKLRSILSQKYSGDINILPAMGVWDLPKVLKNPTTEFMMRSCLLGERATWPKLSRIRDRCAVELALDRAVHALRARVVFSKSQVDLRRMATGSLARTHGESHGTLAPGSAQAWSLSTKDKLKYRHRRSSGSNLSNPLHHGLAKENPYKITDDDTDEEERLEMATRHTHAKPKIKIKRFPKGHMLQTGPRTSPILSSTTEPDSFDFSQPVTPTGSKNTKEPPPKKSTLSTIFTIPGDDSVGDHATETASMTSPQQVPHEGVEVETSDLHTSDADEESHTDDETTPSAPKLWNIHGKLTASELKRKSSIGSSNTKHYR
ncbi:patatin-domain-containing protein [Annulohypoxylon maeteangense]|uniref:patatin-domain-containing protein n=1 Tax=Annulohypoxylon maeteangense TaxID=1927788 RepID=UPI002007C45F|nr:patatin-domain-containing protein [Annulohypoxylon maeteangense]KAI0882392.1 patatin-domain-containing protein [Annulohypoxylon maeteangense]